MIDGVAAMEPSCACRLEPDISNGPGRDRPVKWAVIEAGLKNCVR